MRFSLGMITLALLCVLTGCGNGKKAAKTAKSPGATVSWPAPPDALARARLAGLKPETHEFFAYHVHAHLDVFVDGKSVRVPAGIGIKIHDPAVHSGPASDGTTSYGGIDPPCKSACISPLHTHDDSGVLHTESQQNDPNRLGAFFTEWSVRLSRQCVDRYCSPKTPIAFFVDGKPFTGDPRTITLTDQKEIAIAIGKPPSTVPSAFPAQ